MRLALLAGSAMAVVLMPSATLAQEADDVALEEIVVTAQRREENLQRAAVPVSAVSGEALAQQSVTQATDLTRLVPSLQVAPASSFTQIYLRGVGTFGANAFAEQGDEVEARRRRERQHHRDREQQQEPAVHGGARGEALVDHPAEGDREEQGRAGRQRERAQPGEQQPSVRAQERRQAAQREQALARARRGIAHSRSSGARSVGITQWG